MKSNMTWWYLSYAEETFKGAVIVFAKDLVDACVKAAGISPGGQVLGVPIPKADLPDARYRNRLLSVEDVKEFWPDAISVGEAEKIGLKPDAEILCADCAAGICKEHRQ